MTILQQKCSSPSTCIAGRRTDEQHGNSAVQVSWALICCILHKRCCNL